MSDKLKRILYNSLDNAENVPVVFSASQDKNNEYSDCFVLGLSTHGHEIRFSNVGQSGQMLAANVWRHGVLGEDCTTLFVDEIMDIFKNAKGLIGKPKLFFLQVRFYFVIPLSL